MQITLMNYNDEKTAFEVGELQDIATMEIEIVSGDEILCVTYNDGSSATFDTGLDRIMDFYDGDYVLYDKNAETNLLDDENWLNRADSYTYN